jgi:enoyl-CoA hydratase/carnithine racemase
MSYQFLLYEVNDRVATITLNRPERHDAPSQSLVDEIIAAVAAADPEVRVLVVTGAGGRAFSAGDDIREQRRVPPDLHVVVLATPVADRLMHRQRRPVARRRRRVDRWTPRLHGSRRAKLGVRRGRRLARVTASTRMPPGEGSCHVSPSIRPSAADDPASAGCAFA